jgi:hypothetical protein
MSGPFVVRGAAVAERDVEVPVGSERELTAVVVRLRLVDDEQVAPRRPIGNFIANSSTCVSPDLSV